MGCGYPDYRGFDKNRSPTDAGATDGAQEAGEDAAYDATEAEAPADVVSEEAGVDAQEAEAAEDADAVEPDGARCTSNDDCGHDPAGPLCDLASGRCGACLPQQDVCPPGQYCSATTLRCEVGCKGDPDCVVAGPDGGKDDAAPVDDAATEGGTDDAGQADVGADAKVLTCDPASHACTGCEVDDDCPLGTLCVAPACVAGCTIEHGCPAGWSCCGAVCLDTSVDPQHCGNCDTKCADPPHAQAACESGSCVIANCTAPYQDCDSDYTTGCETDISTSLQDCGGCGAGCVLPHAKAQCTSGTCGIALCDLGFADCDDDPWNGCEVETSSDEADCGTCGHVCGLLPHATPACIGSACEIGACDDGYADCNASAADGCETPTQANVNNCGGCSVACSMLHANAACAAGTCAIASCISPWANCDGLVGNGCEVDVTQDPANCGQCKNACSYPHAAGVCVDGSCEMGVCAAGYGDCNVQPGDGCEAPLTTDVMNCGACGATCGAPHTVPGCAGGTCEAAACVGSWGDCDTIYANGCEVDLATSVDNCGSCGKVCSFPHASAQCSNGTCALGVCDTGYADCDGVAANGCEVNTQTSAANCGACGAACDSTHGVASCSGGHCGIACQPGFADCNDNPVDGCEAAITNNVASCGACGATCSVSHGNPACNGTICQVAQCEPGWGDCNGQYADGCEQQLVTTADCGLCGNPCSPANATGTCATGTCVIASCNPGYLDCDGDPTNGCEVNLNIDVNHCGSCAVKCPSPGCTPKCTTGVCGCSTCTTPGTADCDGDPGNGCETTTSSDPNNCGGCGSVCLAPNGTAGCASSSCTIASCHSGWADCNAVVSDGCETNLHTLTDCGSCGSACNLPHATESCSTGTCQVTTCDPGWGNCDNNGANGCETDTSLSPQHCGSCGNACDSTNGTATCSSGACGIVCNGGFANCDGLLSNGCETNTDTSAANCGACGTVCDATHGTPSCSWGTCTIACNAGWGDCDNNASNGCETSTSASVFNCGACGTVCSSVNGTAACTSGVCSIACNSGFGNCDNDASNGCESSLQNDVLHCGSCTTACNLAHAVNACVGGACAIGSCNTGWADCDSIASNGCETNTGTGVNNCVACGNICNATNGTPTCSAGTCGIICTSGWGNCDGSAANGCEVSTNTSVDNCGACGNVCPSVPHGTAACLAGTCGVGACDANYHESSGACVPNGEICDNGVDDDNDGRVDCFDTDCLTSTACAGRCMDAASVGCDVTVLSQNTGATGSTQRIAPPSYSCTTASMPGPEYAYKFTGTAGQNVFVEAYGLSGDVAVMAVDVATGAQCTASTSCAKAGNANSNANPEAIGFTSAAGRDYYIVVDGPSAQAYSLSVQCSTTGGCFPARAIQAGQTISASNAVGQGNTTNDAIESYSCGSWAESGPEAAFIFTPTESGSYEVDLTSLSNDCDLYVLSANNCDGTCFSSYSYSDDYGTNPESVTFTATANKSYFIVVDGYSGNVCSFNLSVTKL